MHQPHSRALARRSVMRAATFVLSVLLLVLALPATAAAQDNGRKERNKPTASVTAGFAAGERQVIASYFAAHSYTAEELPPGIVKKLARGKPLPPGIAKRSLPRGLVAQLPAREGFEITIFGDRIVLLEASGLVVDILAGIFD
jgi:hypothetical protein